MPSRRPLVILPALLLTIALLAAACSSGGDADADGGEAGSDDEPITLQYFNWAPDYEERERAILDRFEEAYPHITVEQSSTATPEYWTEAEALAAAGDLPDVMYMSSGFVEEWATDDLIVSLADYVEADIDPDDFFLDLAEIARHPDSGELHAFPFAFVTTILYYNADAFAEAGLDEPAEGWTWDDFLEAAQATTVDEDGDGTPERYGHFATGRYTHIESWIYQNGADFLSEDRREVAFDDGATEALRFLDDLVHTHGVAPTPAEMEGLDPEDVFGQGLSAMLVEGIFAIPGIRDVVGGDFEWRIAPLPRGPQWSEDVAYGWPDLLAISSDSEHPDEAWELVKWLTGEERAADEVDEGKLPVYRPVVGDEAILEPDEAPDNQELMVEWAEHVGSTSFTPGWGEWRGYTGGAGMEALLNEAFDGRMDLEEALEATEEQANEILARHD